MLNVPQSLVKMMTMVDLLVPQDFALDLEVCVNVKFLIRILVLFIFSGSASNASQKKAGVKRPVVPFGGDGDSSGSTGSTELLSRRKTRGVHD